MSSVSVLLDDLGTALWRADALARSASAGGGAVASGHAALDAQLPGGGWPLGALCDILQDHSGQHEWRLLLPTLRTLTQTVVLVGPPQMPFGPGLAAQGLDVQALCWVRADSPAERLWAAEQVLQCAGVAALLLWLPQTRAEPLRRLQLAAQAHAKLLWVMRPASARHEASPAVLRLWVGAGPVAQPDALAVHILKRRGPPLLTPLHLPARHAALGTLLALPGRGTLPESGHALDRLAAAA
ncbi:translesion DNA synthesis-associated protein ImuA [Rhodoferax sp.]|uniref:translesion DNA synthesis-associated protein ImuA n=1 Tax=Rhodoferax sp. TaxID=50421 RepID=UPI002627F23D|nr:translesion DNA synthesis-associated protein ImuA [Rhodoferax sp.]MDD2925187.1 translesion DNA synthesis-associated protein ImuA [Rhodoferax sp.]